MSGDLDALAAALAALDEAMAHNYTRDAAAAAAADRVAGLDADQAREALAALAGLVAWWSLLDSWTPSPRPTLELADWVQWGRCRVAGGELP